MKRQPANFPHRSLGGGTKICMPIKLAFHARSPPDGFLFSYLARFKIITVLEMLGTKEVGILARFLVRLKKMKRNKISPDNRRE